MSAVTTLSLESSNVLESSDGYALLRHAEAGNVDAIMALLASVDVSINARDYDGCTALALAARNGHAVVVEKLLAHGANPNFQDLEQAMPLWHAAKHGNRTVVRLLLANGGVSDVNVQNTNGRGGNESDTPLSVAMKGGHRETAGLMAHIDGIDPCIKTISRVGGM